MSATEIDTWTIDQVFDANEVLDVSADVDAARAAAQTATVETANPQKKLGSGRVR